MNSRPANFNPYVVPETQGREKIPLFTLENLTGQTNLPTCGLLFSIEFLSLKFRRQECFCWFCGGKIKVQSSSPSEIQSYFSLKKSWKLEMFWSKFCVFLVLVKFWQVFFYVPFSGAVLGWCDSEVLLSYQTLHKGNLNTYQI